MFLGLPTFTQTFTNNDYAKIGNYGISQSEYFRTKNQIEQNIRDQFGQQIDLVPLASFIEEQAKTSLIEKYSIIKFFDELDLIIPQNYIETELSRNEAFQIDGMFDQEAFKNYLINFNLSKEQLIRDYSSDLKLNLSVALLDSLVNVFDSTLDQYLDLLTEQRTIKFVTLDTSNVISDYQPDEPELLEYYSANNLKFLEPEKVSFNLVSINKEKLELTASSDELEDAYNLYLDSIPEGEKRISHVMIIRDNYESEEEFNNKITSAEEAFLTRDFSEVVKMFSDDDGTVEVDGDLGFTDGQVFPEEFELEISKLNQGDISKKIVFENNIHFLKVTDVNKAQIETFEEKYDELSNEIANIKFEDIVLNVQNSISGTAINLKQIEEQFKVTAKLIPLTTKGETGFSIDEEENIFTSSLNLWSDPLNINSNSFQIVQPVLKEEENIKDYELVKMEIIETLIEDNRLSILENVYASEEKIILEENFLRNTFPINGFKIEEFQNINRTTSLLANDVVNIVFSQPYTGIVSRELINNQLFIYDVIERKPGDPSSVSEEDRASIISQSRSSQLQYLFNTLRTEYGLDDKYTENQLIVNQTS